MQRFPSCNYGAGQALRCQGRERYEGCQGVHRHVGESGAIQLCGIGSGESQTRGSLEAERVASPKIRADSPMEPWEPPFENVDEACEDVDEMQRQIQNNYCAFVEKGREGGM